MEPQGCQDIYLRLLTKMASRTFLLMSSIFCFLSLKCKRNIIKKENNIWFKRNRLSVDKCPFTKATTPSTSFGRSHACIIRSIHFQPLIIATRINFVNQIKRSVYTHSAPNPLTCSILICFTIVDFPDSPAPWKGKQNGSSLHIRLVILE